MSRSNRPSPRAFNIKKLIQAFGVYGISNAVSQMLMILYAFLLARFLGPGLFGIYTGHLSFVLLFSFVINWGFDTFFLFRSGALRDSGAIDTLNGQIILAKAGLGGLWILALALASQFLHNTLFTPLLIALAAADTLADSLFFTQLTSLNVKQRTTSLSLLLFSSRLFRLGGGVAAALLGIYSVEVILLIRVVTSLIFLALAFLITRPRFFQGSLAKLSSLWRSSIPYGLSETFALIYAQVDISLLAILLGDTETGLYTTANRLIIALFSIPNAAYLIVIPKLRQVLLNKQDQSRSYFLRVLAVFLAVGLILFLGVFFAGPWMVDLVLQDAYTFSGELLRLMSVVLLLKSLSFGLGAMIVALGWQKYRLIPQVVTSLLAIGLNLFIIPVHGLTGAASVYILSEGVLLVGYGILVLRWLLKRKTP